MKISALRLFNVKRFSGRGVAIEGIGDGVNVLCAANEFGKSTSFEALHALFFQSYSGKSGSVRVLRPYSGGNPLIEADIASDTDRFRITKQYFGNSFARITDLATGSVVAQMDEAENFISALVKGGPAGPAGLLWVRQGVTGIERRSNAEEDSEKQVRATLLQSVQGEVEAITGGRRMAEIMQAVAGELDRLVTKRGPKAGGRYVAALELRDRLVTEERKLAGDVAALRAALDQRASAQKRLAERDGTAERQERHEAVANAQAAFETAKAQGERLKTAEAELKLAGERRDGAQRELDTFRDAMLKAKQLHADLLEAGRRRLSALAGRRDATDRVDQAVATADAAESEEQEMRDLLARLDAAMRAREASERLTETRQRLIDAEGARKALEDIEAKLALVAIPPDAVDELHGVEVDLARLRAIAETARATVTMAYEASAEGRVTMDGTALMDGSVRSYDGQAELAISGVGVISLRSNRALGDDAGLRTAEAKRRALLASMGVDTLAEARERQSRAQQWDAERREVRARLSSLAPAGLPKLAEDVAALERDCATAEVPPDRDPTEVRAALSDAQQRRNEARLAVREAQPAKVGAEEAFVAAETLLAKLDAERQHVVSVLGPEEHRDTRGEALSRGLAELAELFAQAAAKADDLRARAVDLASAEAALRRAQSAEQAAEREIGSLRETIAGLNAEIRARTDEAVEEAWRETADALTAAEARVSAFEKEVAVLQTLSAALDGARSEARELYLKPVMAELSPLLRLLFDDVSVSFDERTLLPDKILRSGLEEDVERLSGGMREQLSVLTRLAFARLLARDGRPAPVILDDALVYSDDDRIERMFDALHRQSRDQQIIVFSCRQRAFQKLGGHALAMIDWQPS